MGTGHYRFTRDGRNFKGFISSNESSTDALQALSIWSGAQQGRGYIVAIDEDEQLLANLSWTDTDSSAGPDLDSACLKLGVNRFYVDS